MSEAAATILLCGGHMRRLLSLGICQFLVFLLLVAGAHAAECDFFNQTVVESDSDLQLILSQVDRLLKVQLRSDTGTSRSC